MVIRGHQQSRTAAAERFKILKRLEHIDRVADIVKEDVVKILVFAEKLQELFRVGKTNVKIEHWISFLRDLNYFAANVYPFRLTRIHRRQEHPGTATN